MRYASKPALFIQFNADKKIEMSQFIYLIAFSIYLTIVVLKTTMLNVYITMDMNIIFNLCFMILIFFKLVFCDGYTHKQLLKIILLSSVLILSWFSSNYNELINLLFIIIGAKNVSFKRIVKAYFYITTFLVIVSMVLALSGIIEHITYYRDGKIRYAFGSIYCTDFASHIFYLIVSYCYIKFNKLSFFHIFIFILLGSFISYYCGARLDSACVFITSIIFTIILIKRKKNIKTSICFNPIIKTILIFSVPLCAIISIFLTNAYTPYNSTISTVNDLLSNRLYYGKKGILDYGIKLFGQQVQMNGYGDRSDSVTHYFFIDCSYLNIALRFGIVVLIIFCIYFVIFNKKRFKSKDTLIPIIIFLISINSMIAQHFSELSYNPFLLVFFSSIKCNLSVESKHDKKQKEFVLEPDKIPVN